MAAPDMTSRESLFPAARGAQPPTATPLPRTPIRPSPPALASLQLLSRPAVGAVSRSPPNKARAAILPAPCSPPAASRKRRDRANPSRSGPLSIRSPLLGFHAADSPSRSPSAFAGRFFSGLPRFRPKRSAYLSSLRPVPAALS